MQCNGAGANAHKGRGLATSHAKFAGGSARRAAQSRTSRTPTAVSSHSLRGCLKAKGIAKWDEFVLREGFGQAVGDLVFGSHML